MGRISTENARLRRRTQPDCMKGNDASANRGNAGESFCQRAVGAGPEPPKLFNVNIQPVSSMSMPTPAETSRGKVASAAPLCKDCAPLRLEVTGQHANGSRGGLLPHQVGATACARSRMPPPLVDQLSSLDNLN